MTAATRRAVLAGMPAAAAVALPPSASSSSASSDPGLSVLEEGMKRWRGLNAKRHALGDLAEQLTERAIADCFHEPQPIPPKELLPYVGDHGYVAYGAVPDELRGLATNQMVADSDWHGRKNAAIKGHPAAVKARDLHEQEDGVWAQMWSLRDEMLVTRTSSPRGFLLKLAFAVDVGDLDAIEGGIKEHYDPDDYLPQLLADLRGMR